jgi:hypothetical protein
MDINKKMDFSELNNLEGLQFIPVNDKKIPIVKNWQTLKVKHDLSIGYGVGLVCGELSGGIEALDFDLKYDLTGKLFDKYKKLIASYSATLLNKMVVQKTKNNGYHLIYRCGKIEGNLKLANRHTTIEEKKATYDKTYMSELLKEGVTDDAAKKTADKASNNDKVRVLIESRGIGGQIVCFPTNGYELVYGDFYSISEISIEERDILISTARQFNEFIEEYVVPKNTYIKKSKGISSFEDYNQRGDVVKLLENNGWQIVGQKGQKTMFLRPGQTTAQSSGNFDHSKNWFSVFTTSSEFEPERAYMPYAVFAVLECNKDFKEASKKLYDLGYGDREEVVKKESPQSTRQIPSRINSEDEDFSFLATGKDYDEYLHQVRTGTLKMGLTTGSPALDEHFLFKEGNLVMTNGIDNTGKSVFTWWLLLVAAMYHGWKGIIFSSENTLGSFMRKMIQFYWGKPLHGKFAMSESEYLIAKKFVEEHFSLIKAQEDLYNYKDIINMVKKARTKNKYNYGLIDPYNSLKIDLSGFSKLSTHEYHYEAMSEIKAYGQQTKFGWFINHHAVTAAARLKDGDRKYPVAPQKADTEGGQKVPNKADDFLTIHRLTQHPTEWMVTELHVRKIKETDTGGRSTPFDIPVKFEMYKGGCAFIERLEFGGNPVDPIHSWHLGRELKQANIEMSPIEEHKEEINNGWKPYKEDF